MEVISLWKKNKNIFWLVNNSEYHHREMGLMSVEPRTKLPMWLHFHQFCLTLLSERGESYKTNANKVSYEASYEDPLTRKTRLQSVHIDKMWYVDDNSNFPIDSILIALNVGLMYLIRYLYSKRNRVCFLLVSLFKKSNPFKHQNLEIGTIERGKQCYGCYPKQLMADGNLKHNVQTLFLKLQSFYFTHN